MLRCVAATGLLRSAGPQRYELTDACRAAMDGWAFAGFRFGFITAILQAHPGVRGILAELDRALPGARAHLAANGLADRCDIVACDFFTDPLPQGAGGYLLAHVIHNWNDDRALAILRAVRAAIPDDGRLLLVEAIIPDDDSPHLAKDLDIRLISILPGGGRTEPEYARLLTQAGFRAEPASGLAGNDSVMAATPAGVARW